MIVSSIIINNLICVIYNAGGHMIKNNLVVDVNVKCIEEGKTQAQLA